MGHLIAARHDDRKGRHSPAAVSGTTVVVDGRLGKVLHSVLHGERCIRSLPRHGNEDNLLWSIGSPKRAVVTEVATWSGSASGPTVGPTSARAASGPGVPLGPSHEERGTVMRAVHYGHSRRKIRECGGSLAEQTGGQWRGEQDARSGPFYSRTA
jgi:hypothetical protein